MTLRSSSRWWTSLAQLALVDLSSPARVGVSEFLDPARVGVSEFLDPARVGERLLTQLALVNVS